jgi:hypothetical protein
VRLVCPACRRDLFGTMTGFVNHCRILHDTSFSNYDEAVLKCGVPVPGKRVPRDDPARTARAYGAAAAAAAVAAVAKKRKRGGAGKKGDDDANINSNNNSNINSNNHNSSNINDAIDGNVDANVDNTNDNDESSARTDATGEPKPKRRGRGPGKAKGKTKEQRQLAKLERERRAQEKRAALQQLPRPERRQQDPQRAGDDTAAADPELGASRFVTRHRLTITNTAVPVGSDADPTSREVACRQKRRGGKGLDSGGGGGARSSRPQPILDSTRFPSPLPHTPYCSQNSIPPPPTCLFASIVGHP